MYAYYQEGKIVVYYSLLMQENNECELNNISVLPGYRHQEIGAKLLLHSFLSIYLWLYGKEHLI